MRFSTTHRTVFSKQAWLIILLSMYFWALAIQAAESADASSSDSESAYLEQLKNNESKIIELQNEVEITSLQRKQLLQQLNEVRTAGVDREQRIEALKRDITLYESQVEDLEALLSNTDNTLAASKQLLQRVIRASVQTRANSGLQVMLQHDDAALANRLGVYYDYFFRAQADIIKRTSEQLDGIRQAHNEALKSRNWLQHLKRKAGEQKAAYAEAEASTRASVKQADDKLQVQQKTVESLKSEQARLARLIEELRKNALGSSGQFAAHKGKYPWPVAGTLGASFGETKSVGKLKWTGIVIKAAAGKPVRAIADGEIVYADWLQGFGMLVIIDHGDNYMTLYGGNRDVAVHAGDWAEFGATIATVGNSVGQTETGLYFEIRHNAKPVNPEAWISMKNRF